MQTDPEEYDSDQNKWEVVSHLTEVIPGDKRKKVKFSKKKNAWYIYVIHHLYAQLL